MNVIYRDIETGKDIQIIQVSSSESRLYPQPKPNGKVKFRIGSNKEEVEYTIISSSQESLRYQNKTYPTIPDMIINVIQTKRMEKLDDNVYRFANGRLVPFGKIYTEKYLPDGIWYVHHEEYSEGHTNADSYIPEIMHAKTYTDEHGVPITGIYKIGEAEKIIDLPELCGEYEIAQKILGSKEFKDWYEKSKTTGYSLNEMVCFITGQVIYQCNQRKNDEGSISE